MHPIIIINILLLAGYFVASFFISNGGGVVVWFFGAGIQFVVLNLIVLLCAFDYMAKTENKLSGWQIVGVIFSFIFVVISFIFTFAMSPFPFVVALIPALLISIYASKKKKWTEVIKASLISIAVILVIGFPACLGMANTGNFRIAG